jgi:hypothetical protein
MLIIKQYSYANRQLFIHKPEILPIRMCLIVLFDGTAPQKPLVSGNDFSY